MLINLWKIRSKNLSKNRRNELAVELRLAMDRIANRIDRGYNIEIRVAPIQEQKQEGTEEDKAKDIREQIKLIQEAGKTLRFLKLQGEPILSLPESEKETPKKNPAT
jgi:hypothetical protein